MDQFSIEIQHRENRLWQSKIHFYLEEMEFYTQLLFESKISSDIIKILKKRVNSWNKRLNVFLERVKRSEKSLKADALASKTDSRDHEELRYDVSKMDMEYHIQIQEFQAVLLGLGGI